MKRINKLKERLNGTFLLCYNSRFFLWKVIWSAGAMSLMSTKLEDPKLPFLHFTGELVLEFKNKLKIQHFTHRKEMTTELT